MRPKVVVHGGAGSWDERDFAGASKKAGEIAENTYRFLEDGGSAIDAVERAVNFFEEEHLFNAGTGGYLQLDGRVRLDAAVMKSDLDCGAVSSLEDTENAISVAREVMESTPHAMMSGRKAKKFAREFGYGEKDLKTDGKVRKWEEINEKYEDLDYRQKVEKLKDEGGADTVGCVAMDKEGRMAAATSTGGRKADLPGRVGDSPLIGPGAYCNTEAGVSVTGVGEDIIKSVLARRCVEQVESGHKATRAAEKALKHMSNNTEGTAGIIVIDREGNIGIDYSSDRMVCAKKE